jgi:RNA polymerase sigma-70 factor (ECF subfamily)
MQNEGDRYLIDCVRQGDEAAFRQLVDRYSGRLTAYASRRMSRSGTDPEDAVQDTFLGLLQSLERGEERVAGIRSLEAYLYQILRHKIYDLMAKRPEAHGLRRVPLAGADADGLVEGYEPIAAGGTPSSYVRRGEEVGVTHQVLSDVLEEFIGQLKSGQNFRDLKILELLFMTPWMNKKIAAAAGTSDATVTRVKQDALGKLSRLVGRHPSGSSCHPHLEEKEDASKLIRTTWSGNLLSCLKRSTLGAYALGAVDSDWKDYITFHLEKVGCETCAASLEDIRSEGESKSQEVRERVFVSSVGFLRKLR